MLIVQDFVVFVLGGMLVLMCSIFGAHERRVMVTSHCLCDDMYVGGYKPFSSQHVGTQDNLGVDGVRIIVV